MAFLDIVKAKEAELKGQPELVTAVEIEKLESPIAWRVLHHFDPITYPEEMPDGFKAVGVAGGNMSYGFNITMPNGTKTFLKVEKRADQIQAQASKPTDLESQLKFADKLGGMGVPTAKPLRSGAGEEKEKSFSITLPVDESLPEQIRGCQVSHQSALAGPALQPFAAQDKSTVIGAARTLGQFQKAGAKYVSETKDHGIVKDSRNVPGKVAKVPTLITQFLEDVGLAGRDIREIDALCKQSGADHCVIFKSLLDKNQAYIESNQASTDPATIIHVEQVKQLSEAATNGNLAKHIGVLATMSDRNGDLQSLPKGFVHNDSHIGNFMSDNGRVSIVDHGEISTNGLLAVDFLSLLMLPLVFNHGGQKLGDIRVTKDSVKPILAEYDAARSFASVPRLSEKEVNNMFLIFTGESGFHSIADHVHHVTGAVTDFAKENKEGQIKPRKNINESIADEVKYVNEVKDKPLGKWLQETRVEALDALDLATFVLSPEVQQIATEMGAFTKTKPPLDSERKDKSQQTFAEKMASRTQHGSREV